MKHIFFIVLALIATVQCGPITNTSAPEVETEPEKEEYLLNETTIPLEYNLEIRPFLTDSNVEKQFTFNALVQIKIQATEPNRKTIRIHCKNLDFIYPSSLNLGDNILQRFDLICDKKTEIGIITLDAPLDPEKIYELQFFYNGHMGDDMHGFYKSSYNVGDKTEWLATTQLQQTHARRVLPCWDEPKYKAVFKVAMLIERPYIAYSNMEVHNITDFEDDKNWVIYMFHETPRMSTYLLAMIVSKFVRTSDDNDLENSFGILSRHEQRQYTQYSLDVGKKLLAELGNYLKSDYYDMPKITKMDMAALPDFSAGAMENWGLLTYRETNLLYSPADTPDLTKQRIAAVIAHEQAHMWFGDLLTCESWGVTWLNEGFARYFQYFGTAFVETEWDLELQFPIEQVQSAFIVDASETHALTHDVFTPAEASNAFDNISYNKGAAILRMIKHLIGADKFQTALQNYVDTTEKVVKPEDLFKVFEEEKLGVTVDMEPWTTKPGYPLVTVYLSSDGKTAKVNQSRFLYKKDPEDTSKWSIPLTFTTKKNIDFNDLENIKMIREESENIENIDAGDSWVIFNIQQTGYYRVNYNTENWRLIQAALNSKDHDGIHEVNRAQIIDDLLNLGRAGDLKYDFVFEIIQYLSGEKHYLPWLSAFNSFSFLSSRMNKEALQKFRVHIGNLVKHVYEHLDFNQKINETQIEIYNRANIINWACKVGLTDCIEKAKNLYEAYKEFPEKTIDVNLRGAIYCSALRHGKSDDYEFLLKKFLSEELHPSEKIVILNALGCVTKQDLIEKQLQLIVSPVVRLQDKKTALAAIYTSSEENLEIVYNYAKENIKEIEKAFSNDKAAVVSIFSTFASRFTTSEQISDFETFIEANREYFETLLDSSLANAKENLVWIEKNIPVIEEYIDSLPDSAISISISLLLVGISAIFVLIV